MNFVTRLIALKCISALRLSLILIIENGVPMKSKLITSRVAISVASILGVLSSSAMALPNGKPFQELSSAIETNAEAITVLQANVSEINTNIIGVYSLLEEMDGRIGQNAQDISDALLRISANEGDLDVLQSDIGLLRGQLLDAIDAIEREIALIRDEIRSLASENEKLAADLAAAVLELTGAIDANSTQIDALETKVNLLTAAVATNNTRISTLKTRVGDMSIDVVTNKGNIEEMVTALAALKEEVDAGQNECLAEITVGESVTGELVQGGECMAVSGGGSLPAMFYQFTLYSTTKVSIEARATATGEGTLGDPYISLYSGTQDGEVIDRDDDSGTGGNARLTRTLHAGVYVVEVRPGLFGSRYGTYTFTVF